MQRVVRSLTFRLAQPGDFNAIVKLSKEIYSGHDYLPFTFHQWLQRDSLAVLLAFSGNKLVGLNTCFVVDDGQTLINRAKRIQPELQGQGLACQLKEFVGNFARGQFPSVRRERSVVGYEKVTSQNETKILEYDVLSYQVMQYFSQAQTTINKSNELSIEPCSRQHLCNILQSPTARAKLFPENVIVVNSCPFEPIQSNVDFLLQECSEVFVDKCADDVLPSSISFGTLSPRVKCVHWRVFVYTNDPSLFVAHLLSHFKRANEVISGDFVFVSFQDESFTQLAKEVMEKQLQLKECESDFSNKTMKLYEKV